MFEIKIPAVPSSTAFIAIFAIPSATPAWGRSVIPRYFTIFGSHLESLALRFAPVYLPAERLTIYTTPISTIIRSVNTESSNSAPLITKNSTNRGAVQRSTLSIKFSEKSQILQKIVPSIIQTSREENPICTPPIVNFSIESPIVKSTNPTDTARRLEREWKNFSHRLNK